VCFGGNDFGQLGDGTQTSRSTPVELQLPTGLGRVVAGHLFSCRLSSSDLDCWGNTNQGQVGTGLDAFEPNPVQLPGSGWQSLTKNSCARNGANQVSCWGPVITATSGSTIPTSTPTPIGGQPLRLISGTGVWACGLDGNGAAWCWGANNIGLGDGSTTTSRTPVPVAGGRRFSMLDVGNGYACGVELAGSVWCWGVNFNGQLGDGTQSNAATPVAVSPALPVPVLEVATGSGHTCAVTVATRAVWCWGAGNLGQLGFTLPTGVFFVTTPTLAPGLSNFSSLSLGSSHTCGIRAGEVLCWGLNNFGQVGPGGGTTVTNVPPVLVPGLVGVTRIRSGPSNTCAVTGAGAVSCWGFSAKLAPGISQTPTPVPTIMTEAQGATDFSAGNPMCWVAGDRISCLGNNSVGGVGAPIPLVLRPSRVSLP
jgi:alpha-tubulin suppressor-like RCC1 family protein